MSLLLLISFSKFSFEIPAKLFSKYFCIDLYGSSKSIIISITNLPSLTNIILSMNSPSKISISYFFDISGIKLDNI